MMTLSVSMTFVAIYKVLTAAHVLLLGINSVLAVAGHKEYTKKNWVLTGVIYAGSTLGLVTCLHQIAILG